MKGNINSLVELAQEVQRIDNSKEDFVVSGGALAMQDPDTMRLGSEDVYDLTDTAHGQIANKLGIPKPYYDACAEVEGLREFNVNTLLTAKPKNYTVRTIDTKMRALLSDRFLPFDNIHMLSAVLPVLKEQPDLEVHSNSLTDDKMFVQVTCPRLKGEVEVGDPVQYGFSFTNSEVGKGSIRFEEWFLRLVCTNGMVGKDIMRRHHVGRQYDEDSSIFARDTMKADVEALQLKVRDMVAHALIESTFQQRLMQMQAAAGREIVALSDTIANITKRYSLVGEADNITRNLMDNKLTQWGLANSITALAHDVENPEKAYEYEKIGNEVIELQAGDWEIITAA